MIMSDASLSLKSVFMCFIKSLEAELMIQILLLYIIDYKLRGKIID